MQVHKPRSSRNAKYAQVAKSLVLPLLYIAIPFSVACTVQAEHHRPASVEWSRIQAIVGSVHGISTQPPQNVITPKFTSGALMGNGDIGVVAGGPTTTEQRFSFGKSDFWGTHWNEKHNAPEVSILQLGSLSLRSPGVTAGGDKDYRVDQDILNAQVLTTLRLGQALVHLRSFTAENDNVFLTEITTQAPSIELQLRLAMPPSRPDRHVFYPAAAGISENMLWGTRENDLNQPGDYKARAAIAVHLIGSRFDESSSAEDAALGTFVVRAGSPVWVVTAFDSDARTSLDGPSSEALRAKVLAHAQHIGLSQVHALETAHREWWKHFWMRSLVDLHDRTLQDFYYGALYVLGSSSRPGHLPPSLWSNWLTTDNAAWGGRYFMNYNEEAPFYGVFSSNHPELAKPYNRMVLAQFPWQHNRTAAAGYQGVAFQRTFSPFTVVAAPPPLIPVAPKKNYKKLPADQKSNGTFSLLPVIQYWEYTRDDDFLRTQLYPAMRQMDAFWRDFAVHFPDGTWDFEHSSAHEGGEDLNPSLDIGFALRLAHELILTSKILNVDAEMRPIWQSFADHLAPYPSGKVDGEPVYYIADRVHNTIKNHGLFEPGDQPINLEGPVFPGENLAIGGDPVELQTAQNSLRLMNSWGVTKGGNSFNGFCKEFPIAARIGWPADDLVAKFKAAILYQWRPSNLTVFQGGGGIETVGSIETIDSMLLQHELGVLRVFPDWPKDMDASFTNLRAKGAFLVSSQQHDGRVTFIDIQAQHGGTLVVQSPWRSQPVRVDGHKIATDKNGQLTLNFVSSTHHHLEPQ